MNFPRGKELSPGVYANGRGELIIDVAEMLRTNGYEDTPENRAVMTATAERIAKRRGLELQIW